VKWGEVGWGFGGKISKLENERMRKLANGEALRGSEGNGKERKRGGRDFGEKRL